MAGSGSIQTRWVASVAADAAVYNETYRITIVDLGISLASLTTNHRAGFYFVLAPNTALRQGYTLGVNNIVGVDNGNG